MWVWTKVVLGFGDIGGRIRDKVFLGILMERIFCHEFGLLGYGEGIGLNL